MHDAMRAEARWRGIEPTAPARAGHRLSRIACVGILTLLTACGKENRFIAPPPPKVTVELPVQQMVTPYLEATGNTAAVNTVELMARVQGYVQEIKYRDGAAGRRARPCL
jgi:multidrug efflux pump subunit AcrA (membrane-fusion protein)